MRAVVTLKKGEGRTIKSGGLWVFDNEIDSVMGGFENGDLVDVHDFDGYPMGIGFINRNSKIWYLVTRISCRGWSSTNFQMFSLCSRLRSALTAIRN